MRWSEEVSGTQVTVSCLFEHNGLALSIRRTCDLEDLSATKRDMADAVQRIQTGDLSGRDSKPVTHCPECETAW